jgi:hypothetical protein
MHQSSSLALFFLPAAVAVAPRILDPPLGVAVLQQAIPLQMHFGCISRPPVHRLSGHGGLQSQQLRWHRHLCLHQSRLLPRKRRLILLPDRSPHTPWSRVWIVIAASDLDRAARVTDWRLLNGKLFVGAFQRHIHRGTVVTCVHKPVARDGSPR